MVDDNDRKVLDKAITNLPIWLEPTFLTDGRSDKQKAKSEVRKRTIPKKESSDSQKGNYTQSKCKRKRNLTPFA